MIKSLQTLRFLFAILIFTHHFSFDGYQWEAAGPAGVSFFFILSGFVMSIGYMEKVLSQSFSYKNYLINRFIRVYPLHILSLLAYIAIFGVVLTTKQWMILPINLALLQSYIPYDSVYFSGNAVSWCLSTMFLFYVLFPILFRYIHNHFKHSIFILGVLIIFYFIGINNVSENLMHYVIYICPIFRVIDFIIGIVLYETYSRISENIEIHDTIDILPQGLTTFLEILCFIPLVIVVLFYGNIPTQYALASLFWIPISIVILTLSTVRGG